MNDSGERGRAWSAFWRDGGGHACAGSFELEGDGPVAAFWLTAVAGLSADARILDLGTGRGALIGLLLHARPEAQGWRFDGVDLAELPPLPELPPGRVRMHPGTRMEAVPLADASVNLIVSQFGIEYAARDGGVQRECLRLLAARGRIALLMHHADSAITRVSRDELAAQDALLADDGLLAAAVAVLPCIARVRAGAAPDAAAEAARDGFNRAMLATGALIERLSEASLLLETRQSIHAALGVVNVANVAGMLENLAAFRTQLEWGRLRTREQIQAALDEAALEAFIAPWREAGWDMQAEVLADGGQRLGWALTGASR